VTRVNFATCHEPVVLRQEMNVALAAHGPRVQKIRAFVAIALRGISLALVSDQPLLSAHEETRLAETRPGLLVSGAWNLASAGHAGCIEEDLKGATLTGRILTSETSQRILPPLPLSAIYVRGTSRPGSQGGVLR